MHRNGHRDIHRLEQNNRLIDRIESAIDHRMFAKSQRSGANDKIINRRIDIIGFELLANDRKAAQRRFPGGDKNGE